MLQVAAMKVRVADRQAIYKHLMLHYYSITLGSRYLRVGPGVYGAVRKILPTTWLFRALGDPAADLCFNKQSPVHYRLID
jgi:hypothetical protein